MAYLAIDIGGTKILGALLNNKGDILDKEKKSSKGTETLEVVLHQLYKVIDALMERSSETVEGIGIGVPGTTNTEGIISFTPNLPFSNLDLKSIIEERYNIKAVIGNDVNLGTFGEYKQLDIPHGNVVGLFPGTGLGGGIIIDGKLYIGKGSAGELGHIVVQKDGVPCGCGNEGCLESYASKKGILSYLKRKIDKGKTTVLKDEVMSGVLKSSKLKKAYDSNDRYAVKAMNYFSEYMGVGVGIIINVFHPDLIIIGGGIIETFGGELLKEIKRHAKTHAMKSLFDSTEIRSSILADDAVIYGAYHLIREA